jgi:hypothetical protein
MPGLVDGQSHLSFLEKADIVETGFVPVEEHTLQTMHNARRVLLGGFTSCVGASSAKPRLDIAIRNEIKAGRIPGPRLLASTPEITVTGGLGDERLLHMYRESFAVVIDGAEDIRRYVRTMSLGLRYHQVEYFEHTDGAQCAADCDHHDGRREREAPQDGGMTVGIRTLSFGFLRPLQSRNRLELAFWPEAAFTNDISSRSKK